MTSGGARTTPIPSIPQVPAQWRVLRNKVFMREVNRPSPDGSEELLSVSHLTGVTPRSEKTVTMFQAESTLGYKLVRPGDLVINTMWAWMGAAGVAHTEGIVSPAYGVYEVDPAIVDPRWMDTLIRTSAYITEMTRFSKGVTSSRLRLYPDEFLGLSSPIPPVTEQRAITDFLEREMERIDALVTAKRRMVEVLEERRQTTMWSAVSGQVTFAGATRDAACVWLKSIPAHWREGKLTLVARLGSGHTPSRQHPEWWVNPTVPWITTGEVAQMRSDRIEFISETRERISELGIANSSATVHPAGTVVLCRTASAGYSAIMKSAMATSQDFATWTCGPLLRPRFLLLCLRAMRQDLLGRLAMGSTHQTIYMPDIEAIRVPIPPVDEQDAIVKTAYERLAAIDQTVAKLTRQIELLVERRQALITAAVTGQLEIPGVAA